MRLGTVLADWRWANKISLRDAAKMIGISHHTLARFEKGLGVDGVRLAAIMTWMLSSGQIRRRGDRDG